MNKKGLSELITTVLIIGFTIILAAIIMTWGNYFVKNLTVKQASTSDLELECSKIDFKIDEVKFGIRKVNGNDILSLYGSVSNNLGIKIDDFVIQVVKKDGSSSIINPNTDEINTNDILLEPYQTITKSIPEIYLPIEARPIITDEDKIRLIPRLKVGNDIQSCPISYAKEKIII